jgi:hypothetical protein
MVRQGESQRGRRATARMRRTSSEELAANDRSATSARWRRSSPTTSPGRIRTRGKLRAAARSAPHGKTACSAPSSAPPRRDVARMTASTAHSMSSAGRPLNPQCHALDGSDRHGRRRPHAVGWAGVWRIRLEPGPTCISAPAEPARSARGRRGRPVATNACASPALAVARFRGPLGMRGYGCLPLAARRTTHS